MLAPSAVKRGEASDREPAGEFALSAQAVIATTGGIGGNHELVREKWPAAARRAARAACSPACPRTSTGGCSRSRATPARNEINGDRMWHYVEGIRNWDPIWPMHAIRIIPGPSSLWFDAFGRRLPGPLYPGFDTLGTLRHIQRDRPRPHAGSCSTQKIIEKEFALSGSEQNPDTTSKSMRAVLKERHRQRPAAPGAGVHGPRRGLHRRALAAASSCGG